eukprot:evm.model.scf_2610.3 EVM.evm.TU.scf_2610.3   scf_2610:18492-21531(+)
MMEHCTGCPLICPGLCVKERRSRLVRRTLDELAVSSSSCAAERCRVQTACCEAQHDGASEDGLDICEMCHEPGEGVWCPGCRRMFHTVCLSPPALAVEDIPEDGGWSCPQCGRENMAGEDAGPDEDGVTDRMGLTPDWIIHATAFDVFQLPKPTKRIRCIRGLLDPCTNGKASPNIPAEVLYDKADNGLKLSNSWAGFHVLLNPDYKSQIQWRFVNRAIDEVENEAVPAVMLVCRNSTDTAYFQRLRPYPRVLLRRRSVRFKDYDNTPIGFGIVIFCIAKQHRRDLYERFHNAFCSSGEANTAIDRGGSLNRPMRMVADT